MTLIHTKGVFYQQQPYSRHAQTELHTINEETKEDVSSWVRNAKTLQEDIIRSKTMANDIVRQSEAPQVTGEAIEEAEEKAEFLNREVQYSRQLHGVLRGIQYVNELLSEVEAAKNERRILDSLRLLESKLLLCTVDRHCPTNHSA